MGKVVRETGMEAGTEPPTAFPMSLSEFARTHRPGQSIELMGGFVRHAQRQGWSRATGAEWIARYEAFRVSPA